MAIEETKAQRAAALSVDFDAEADVLYISIGLPVASYADEGRDGVLFRRSHKTGSPSGVTALDFLANWADRRPAFDLLVAQYLQLPITMVRQAIKRAV